MSGSYGPLSRPWLKFIPSMKAIMNKIIWKEHTTKLCVRDGRIVCDSLNWINCGKVLLKYQGWSVKYAFEYRRMFSIIGLYSWLEDSLSFADSADVSEDSNILWAWSDLQILERVTKIDTASNGTRTSENNWLDSIISKLVRGDLPFSCPVSQ